MKIKAATICLSVCLLAGCALAPKSTLDALIIQNSGSASVSDVKLSVPETGSIVACGMIMPRFDCSIGFEAVENQNNQAFLSWSQNGRQYRQPLPQDQTPAIHPDYPNKAVVTILDNGVLSVDLD